jgi:hypothetical protein
MSTCLLPRPAEDLAPVGGHTSARAARVVGLDAARALAVGRTTPVAGDDLVLARVRILVRAAWVFAIGGVLEALGTDIDVILDVYAVLFVLALPFLRWPPRRLLMAAGVLAVLTPPAGLLLAHFLGATDSVDEPFLSLVVTGGCPALIWWTFILVGPAVGRSDLGSARVRTTLLAAGVGLAVLGYGGGWVSTHVWAGGRPLTGPSGWSERPDQWDPVWLTGAAPRSGTSVEIAGSVGVAFVVIALCLVAAERLPRVVVPQAWVGSMAFTVYAGSTVAAWALGTMDYADNRPWLADVLGTVVLATAWRLAFGRGPLERLLTWSSTRAAGQSRPPSSAEREPSTSMGR